MDVKKIIATFIIVVISLFFILSSTYNDKTNNKNFKDLGQISYLTWIHQLNQTSTWINYKKIDFVKIQEWNVYVDNLNFIDKVYFSNKDYKKNISSNNSTFSLVSGGVYLFDIYDITNNYLIFNNDFRLKPLSPWRIFVDLRDVNNYKIFSLDAIYDMSLLAWWKEMTSLVIYPKMYFVFSPLRNKFLMNADLLRLETMSKISYYKDPLVDENWNIDNKLKTLLSIDTLFYDLVFWDLYSKNKIEIYNEEKMTKISYKELSGLNYINNYLPLFLNKEKKEIYYKNKIINQLNSLLDGQVIDSEDILFSLAELKNINYDEYEKFRIVLYYYYDLFLKVNSLEYINKSFVLSEIIFKDQWLVKFKFLESSFYLNKVYNLTNAWIYKNDFLQENFLNFLRNYLKENNIELTKDYKINVNKNITQKLDYLSFFLKNILLNNVDLTISKSQYDVVNIIKIYFYLNKNINIVKNYTNTQLMVIENNLIIEKLLHHIRTAFFEPELNSEWLLISSKNNSIDAKSLLVLNEVFQMMFKFPDENKNYLSVKTQIYFSKYWELQLIFKHYYDALKNYPEYLISYNKSSLSLFETKTILEWSNDIKLSNENLVSYLWTFQWLDLSSLKAEIIDNNYYKVDNLYINWEKFSFNLYPQNFNRISNIYKNWVFLSNSYELDSIKYELDKKVNSTDGEIIEKYDFSRFFLNTFYPKNDWNTNLVNNFEQEQELQEDRVIWIFKREKLLWDRWEFSVLKGYLELKYRNIIVKQEKSNYEITLNNIILKTNIDNESETRTIVWELNANYVFSDKDHYFKNISLKFYDSELYATWEKSYLFWWKELKVNKNINIVDFKTEIDNIISEYFNNNL